MLVNHYRIALINIVEVFFFCSSFQVIRSIYSIDLLCNNFIIFVVVGDIKVSLERLAEFDHLLSRIAKAFGAEEHWLVFRDRILLLAGNKWIKWLDLRLFQSNRMLFPPTPPPPPTI